METANINSQLRRHPIAIIGQAAIFPDARNAQEYWDNIIHKINSISDVPASRWKVDDYYDPDPSAPDKTYCKRGGFIPEIDFNPLEFGLPPNILEVTDVSQLLALVVARDLMQDAGYGATNGPGQGFDRERVGVVLGIGGGQKLITPLTSRLQYPVWEKVLKSSGLSDEDTRKIVEKMKLAYIEWNENSFPGMLGNVIAGRIANRLDLGGTNCVVDAACASSLAAVKMAVSELVTGHCDMMLTGGVDTDNSIFMYMSFSKTPAFSHKGDIRPFDAASDGMLIGEGIGMVLLKRLQDAERDQDRIYAVIRGFGASSDGKFKSIYAPRPAGQAAALRRAYQDAGYPPSSIGLLEAHGTGTLAGDPAELEALNEVFANSKKRHIALGSVKSQIGHTKAAAGAASLIKAALALHHKILPPTINISQPNPQLETENTPFYLNTETRPWIRAQGNLPRRAGVSAFGFGGTNFHVTLEEYTGEHETSYRLHTVLQPLIVSAQTPQQLLLACEQTIRTLQFDTGRLRYNELVAASKAPEIPADLPRVGLVAASPAEASQLLQVAADTIRKNLKKEAWDHPKGIYYRQGSVAPEGKVVALFSGQGSQYVEMGRELALNFPPLRQAFGYMDHLFLQDGLTPVSNVVYPPPAFDADQKSAQDQALRNTEYAQPAIGVLSAGLYNILRRAGFKADFAAGHSFGELTALWAGQVLSDEDYFALIKARGQAMAAPDGPDFDAGSMLAVKGDADEVQQELDGLADVIIANFNSQTQVVLAGATPAIESAQQALQEKYKVTRLPVSAAFHTSLVGHASQPFAQAVEDVAFEPAQIPVYSNTTAQPYPADAPAARQILAGHILNPVLFQREIEHIYDAGGYFFVEFGPRSVLTRLVSDILGDRPHLAVALNASRQKSSDRQLREAVVRLQVAGLPLQDIDPFQL
jgi:polyketide-type polyunsaturated fatty acid synthase PfaA